MMLRGLFLRYGLGGRDEMAAFLQDGERPLLCIATDQVEDHVDLLSQNLLELRLPIINNPAGSDGVEVCLIVAACRGDDGGTGMRCQLHRIGAHSAGTTMDQNGLSLFQVTVGEDSLPRKRRNRTGLALEAGAELLVGELDGDGPAEARVDGA